MQELEYPSSEAAIKGVTPRTSRTFRSRLERNECRDYFRESLHGTPPRYCAHLFLIDSKHIRTRLYQVSTISLTAVLRGQH